MFHLAALREKAAYCEMQKQPIMARTLNDAADEVERLRSIIRGLEREIYTLKFDNKHYRRMSGV